MSSCRCFQLAHSKDLSASALLTNRRVSIVDGKMLRSDYYICDYVCGSASLLDSINSDKHLP